MSTRVYWAISHYYGANMRDEHGRMIGTVRAFATKADRDEWVSNGNAYVDQCDSREALPEKDRTVREAVSVCKTYNRGSHFRGHDRKRALLAMFSREIPPAEMWTGEA